MATQKIFATYTYTVQFGEAKDSKQVHILYETSFVEVYYNKPLQHIIMKTKTEKTG